MEKLSQKLHFPLDIGDIEKVESTNAVKLLGLYKNRLAYFCRCVFSSTNFSYS